MKTPRRFNIAMSEEQETAEIAQAILDTSRHVLTGMEIYMLEKYAGATEDDWNEIDMSVEQIQWFHSLQTQFAFQIGKWRHSSHL